MRAANAVLTGDWSAAGREREASQEVAQRSGRSTNGGVFVPPGAFLSPAQRAAALTSDYAELQHSDYLSGAFAEALRPRSAAIAAGATVLHLERDAIVPKGGGLSTSWLAENADAPDSQMTTTRSR